MTNNNKTKEEFIKEFCAVFNGDSGMGGNDPQEPVFEIQYESPNEVIDWFLAKMAAREVEVREELAKKDIEYWKNIFDNPPMREREHPCDNCTKNICRIEIKRLEEIARKQNE